MKRICVMFFLIAALFFGCSKNETPSTPGPNPTPTVPQGNNPDLLISGQISRTSYGTSPMSAIVYMAQIEENSNPVTQATVTVTGPQGTVILNNANNGQFTYISMNSNDYQPNKQYTMTVIYQNYSYKASGTAPGNITVASDGSTASWQYEGDFDFIQIIDPNSGSHTYGPDLTSPFDINNTGVYNNGTGDYNLNVCVIKYILNTFPVSNSESSLFLADIYMGTINK